MTSVTPALNETPPLTKRSSSSHRRISIAYVPLTDCAPLVVAKELGLYEKHGLDVRLVREPGWASVRERMLHSEIDAAHAPASMVFEMTYGLGGIAPVRSLTGLVLAHHGNAIVISDQLRDQGVTDSSSLLKVIRSYSGSKRFTFASVLTYSSQHYLMRDWLRSGGIDPDRDVDMIVVPPPLVAECMEKGHIDGYCVAEPWGSVGLLKGVGQGVMLSSELAPMHPEKIFMVREDFERDRSDEHQSLISCLIEAGRWCDQFKNRRCLAMMLASPKYIDVSVSALENALLGPYHLSETQHTTADLAILFHHEGLDRPTLDKAKWILNSIRQHRLDRHLPQLTDKDLCALFRSDLYDRALPHAEPFKESILTS